MATLGDTAKTQDLPPKGGYKPINFKRVPARSFFNAPLLIGGYIVTTGIGTYFYHLTCKKVDREEIEMRSARFAIEPILLAEKDREFLKQMRRNRDAEAEVMKNVEGWEVGTLWGEPLYHTLPRDTFIKPNYCGYYLHASMKDLKRRLFFTLWS